MKNKKGESMKYFKWFLGIVAILFGIPLFLEFFIFRNGFPSVLNNAEWASFLGSFIGGVISLVGIFLTIRFTQEENRKERELMYRPHIRISKCSLDSCSKFIGVETDGHYADDGKDCSIGVQIKNVGLGPLLNFEIKNFRYVSGKKEEEIILDLGCDKILEKDEAIGIEFLFNLNVRDSDLKDISPDDTSTVSKYLNYGGDFYFEILGNDVCNKSYRETVQIHISGTIGQRTKGEKLEYLPEAHLW